mmetsp:Transcript_28722/g.72225  ORF Transcript_28722/g.72225 Transcript_28722/m.72225 type:complete len:615 (-) Transcript_28722:308-2152(-)|eukprot:CAMPEP_0177637266 /NCGR_PEP_ID=MMETSP0447-20121125/4882_1 /TAXON_ID=0 /ORGANISM="Stygamoeba regulata, Strain BSH-02190019" /LENGTH=614 /DNA_ID=CAMNT_0019139187 /DNA_START=218 /DNA_END=2062 /DNA_ORIENTATION=+
MAAASSAQDQLDVELDKWGLMLDVESGESSRTTKVNKLSSLLQTAKGKFYNLYFSAAGSMPPLTDSPIYVLGTAYCHDVITHGGVSVDLPPELVVVEHNLNLPGLLSSLRSDTAVVRPPFDRLVASTSDVDISRRKEGQLDQPSCLPSSVYPYCTPLLAPTELCVPQDAPRERPASLSAVPAASPCVETRRQDNAPKPRQHPDAPAHLDVARLRTRVRAGSGRRSPILSKAAPTKLSPRILAFLHDYTSRLLFTYRMHFPPIDPAALTTDMGWGCMLRSGQMLLAQAFITHFCGRGWRLSHHAENKIYQKILSWFVDEPCPRSPYSIHRIARQGTLFQKKVGQWFEPSIIAQVLRDLVESHSPDGMRVLLVKDTLLHYTELLALCQSKSAYHMHQGAHGGAGAPPPPVPARALDVVANTSEDTFLSPLSSSPWVMPSSWADTPVAHLSPRQSPEPPDPDTGLPPPWNPIIIIVPARLGIDTVNPVYLPTLQAFLRMPQALGFIGGRPGHSLYIIGFQDTSFFYLDPHIVQDAVQKTEIESCTGSETYHSDTPLKMRFEELDPSLAIGFYCRDASDVEDFCMRINKLCASTEYPVFSIQGFEPRQHTPPLVRAST